MSRLLLIHIPKTAGQSITDVCRKEDIDITCFGHLFAKHMNIDILVKDIFKKKERFNLNDYYSCCFVRNPYDRFMSSYYFYTQVYQGSRGHMVSEMNKFGSFSNFCLNFKDFKFKEDAQFISQYEFCYDDGLNRIVDYIGRFENINEDWKNICDDVGIVCPKLPHINKSKHDKWKDLYTSEMKEIVYNLYKKDFELFRYDS